MTLSMSLLLLAGCGPQKASNSTSSGAGGSNGNGNSNGTNGAFSTGPSSSGTTGTNGSTNSPTTSSSSTTATSATTASTNSTATTGTPTSSTSTSTTGTNGTTGECVPDGVYVGLGNDAECCSQSTDDQGYCGIQSGTTGTNATTGTNGTNSTNGTTGTSGTTGPFGGGWHPLDAGYQPAIQTDGGVTVVVDPTAPSNASTLFNGVVDPNFAPTIVYPPDGVLVPPNMNSLEIHFIPGPGQTVFQITFQAPTATLVAYTGCTAVNGGCIYTPDSTFWSSLVQYARGVAPVTFNITGVNGSNPGSVGLSATQSIAFSDQDITAGIYFWNTSGVVERYDWGYPNAPPETWMDPPTAGALVCVGCHAISRNGDLGVVGKDIPAPATYGVFNVATRQAEQTAGGQALSGSADFFSFSPDSRFLATSDGTSIQWRDLNSGVVQSPAVTSSGTMPDWSPSGLDMVFAKPQSNPFFSEPGVSSASLQVTHFNGAGWNAPTTLVAYQGQNNYYPSYSPDGQWVAFNRSPSDSESFSNAAPDPDAGTVPDGELWAVASGGGGSPIRMDAASNPGALSWPKWAPVISDYYGGHVMWLTFSTARGYGLRSADGQSTELWMVAFDPARAASGQDPSFPAFFLPFQDAAGGNHIAQWVTAVLRQTCSVDSDCPSTEHCVDGRCVPISVTHKPVPNGRARPQAHRSADPRGTRAYRWLSKAAPTDSGSRESRKQLSNWLDR